MSGNEYLARLKQTLAGVIASLRAKAIEERHLSFGGEGAVPTRKPTVPPEARSEFLANRAMGDWAEQQIAEAVVRACPEWMVSQYGDTNRIAAGHPDFKATYLAGLEQTRRFGKRPDLLLFPPEAKVAADLSARTHAETEALVRQAVAAIEVRSSKFEALTYMAVRKRQREAGKTTGRETPSFAVKVEDLVIVYRWLERHRAPESYCQVFFDSVFAINFLDIFATVASGAQIGKATSMPTFAVEHRVTELGRHDAFVVPQGGGFELDPAATRNVLLAEN
jgi:hypothetical protein